MKYPTAILFSAILFAVSCKDKNENTKWLPDVKNENHGPSQKREFKGTFNEIEISQAINAEIIKSDEERVVIIAPSNVIDDILVDRDGDKINIHYRSGIRVMNANRVEAKIYAKDFEKLKVGSAANVLVKDQFTQEKTEIEVTGSGEITGDFEANKLEIVASSSGSFTGKIWAIDLEIDASSAASIDIKGKAKNADLSSSSSASISAKQVLVEHLKAEASSGSDIDISVKTSVNAEASSAGSINITKQGNISIVNKQESSGGSVTIN